MGKVFLIGVGPGDEDLITVKAIKAIKTCDILLYDRLVNKELIKYAKKDCKIYYCGKSSNNHCMKQEDINKMLINFAKEGYTVGRVKGGDPYVFGRGGEEALVCFKEGVKFEVIPGITSAISVLNYAGIPITYREVSQSFHIFTAMTASELSIDWNTVSKLKGTLVFMMGLSNMSWIVDGLLNSGMPKETPSSVIMRGTTSKQKSVFGDLGNILKRVEESNLKSPCIIAFGETVNFYDKLDWYTRKPLFGINVCITRQKEQSYEIKDRLLSLGAEVTEVNSIRTEKIKNDISSYLKKIGEYDHIVFSSVNAIDYFFEEIIDNDIDIRNIKAKFSVIGRKTANYLRKWAIVPEVIAKEFTLEGLYYSMKEHILEGEKVLIPKSKNGRDYLVNKLEEDGLEVDYFSLYRTIYSNRKEYYNLTEVDIVIYTSPSTVKSMVEMFGVDEIRKKLALSIGPITSKELSLQGIDYIQSEEYNTDGILKKIEEYFNINDNKYL